MFLKFYLTKAMSQQEFRFGAICRHLQTKTESKLFAIIKAHGSNDSKRSHRWVLDFPICTAIVTLWLVQSCTCRGNIAVVNSWDRPYSRKVLTCKSIRVRAYQCKLLLQSWSCLSISSAIKNMAPNWNEIKKLDSLLVDDWAYGQNFETTAEQVVILLIKDRCSRDRTSAK